MTSPSRDFMVTQAVLNAAAVEFPVNLRQSGIVHAVSVLAAVINRAPNFGREVVIREYRRIAAQYSEAA